MTQVTIDLTGYPEGDSPESRQSFPAHLRSYAQTLRESWRGSGSCAARTLEFIADQAEAQLPKPKPEEPTGLGAVVENSRGQRYVVDFVHSDGTPRWYGPARVDSTVYGRPAWDDIDAVKVLSPGV